MITKEVLTAIQLADMDAGDFGINRQAKDTCLDILFDGPVWWTCSRRKGHSAPHVDPSLPLPDIRLGRYPYHRWIDSTMTHAQWAALSSDEKRVWVPDFDRRAQ